MVRITFPGGVSNVPQRLGDKLETPPDKVILTITRAMQGMSHTENLPKKLLKAIFSLVT